jgi:toxin ParE1/3/4
MTHNVVFSPEAQDQLLDLYHYIASAASPHIAARYTGAIVDYCDSLCRFPLRGAKRDDIRPGLRITNYRKRAVIAFTVEASAVSVIGIFYGGQDYQSLLQDDFDDQDLGH